MELPAAKQRENESRENGMSSTGFSTGSAISSARALMLTWHKERMYSIRFRQGLFLCFARLSRGSANGEYVSRNSNNGEGEGWLHKGL